MKISVKSEYREFVKLFSELTGSRSLYQVFCDCIEMYAISIQNSFKVGKEYYDNERRYKDIVSLYSQDEVSVIMQIFALITDMLIEDPFRDLLGELYMQLNMGSDALGQFFTPYSVACLNAQVGSDVEEIQEIINKNGYITVSEPACGGGANVIAFCEMMYKNNINYQTSCVIVCQELSRITALMCYVVLSLIGCAAVIKVGDTIANPYTNYYAEIKKKSELWTTPMFHLYNCYSKV